MTKRKIISDACTEKSPLNVLLSTNCIPGFASSARMNIAIEPAPTKKKIVVTVLDADDLVVGVDTEVVAPAAGAVA